MEKSVLFIAPRAPTAGAERSFKCHAFATASVATAKALALHLTQTCATVLKKLELARLALQREAAAASSQLAAVWFVLFCFVLFCARKIENGKMGNGAGTSLLACLNV